MVIINGSLLFFLCYRIVQIVRRFLVFRSREVEKDELLEELAKAKDKIAKLTLEKNQLYALKVNTLYQGMAEAQRVEEKAEKEEEKQACRRLPFQQAYRHRPKVQGHARVYKQSRKRADAA